jgi:hypothetical protein
MILRSILYCERDVGLASHSPATTAVAPSRRSPITSISPRGYESAAVAPFCASRRNLAFRAFHLLWRVLADLRTELGSCNAAFSRAFIRSLRDSERIPGTSRRSAFGRSVRGPTQRPAFGPTPCSTLKRTGHQERRRAARACVDCVRDGRLNAADIILPKWRASASGCAQSDMSLTATGRGEERTRRGRASSTELQANISSA